MADYNFEEANDLRGLTYAADGKIYASGHTNALAGDRQLVVARFNADGTPDTTFDDDGFLVYNISVAGPGNSGDEQSFGIVELDNGDIIVQANATDGKGGAAIPDSNPTPGADGLRPSGVDVVLLRFTDEGELVDSFGDNGIARVDFGWKDADDASWPAPTYNSAVTSNGGFSGAGFPTDTSWGIRLDKSVAGNEKIVLFGHGPAMKVTTGTQRTDNDRYIARVLASTGAPDPDFNTDGTPFTLNVLGTIADNGRRGMVEPDGSIVAGGYTNAGTGFGNHVVLIRLLPNGTPDPAFGFGTGHIGTTFFNPFIYDGGAAECYDVVRQKAGGYVTTGYGGATGEGRSSMYDGYVTTLKADLVSFRVKGRELDLTYGNEGTFVMQSEELTLGDVEDRGRALVVLPDDRLVHVGRFGVHPTVFVTTPDGELDTTVGDEGTFVYPPDGGDATPLTAHFFSVALSADGKRIAAATTNDANGVLLVVLEVEED